MNELAKKLASARKFAAGQSKWGRPRREIQVPFNLGDALSEVNLRIVRIRHGYGVILRETSLKKSSKNITNDICGETRLMKMSILIITLLLVFHSAGCSNTNPDVVAIKQTHKKNFEDLCNMNFEVLETNFSKEYMILDEGVVVDFVAEVMKESESPHMKQQLEKLNVDEFFDMENVMVWDYRTMTEKSSSLGLQKHRDGDEGLFMKSKRDVAVVDGDYLAIIRPKKAKKAELNIESFSALYRKTKGKWVAIGGFR